MGKGWTIRKSKRDHEAGSSAAKPKKKPSNRDY
jgi:hypothetical protein